MAVMTRPLSIVSENWSELSTLGKVGDYFHHIALPVAAMVIGGFAVLTMLTKNSFMEEIHKQYVMELNSHDEYHPIDN